MNEKFPLLKEDFEAVEIATNVANLLLRHPAITPKEIIGLGYGLYALGRLPLATPGVRVEFGAAYRFGDDDFSETRYIHFEISEDIFEISRGGSVYERLVGSDSFSDPSWLVELGGYRSTECELYNLEDEVRELLDLGAKPSVSCESAVGIDELGEEQTDE